MGQKSSSTVVPKDPRIDKHRSGIGLPEDKLEELFNVFSALDKANCGSIDNDAFLEFLGVKRTIMTDGIFELIDSANRGVIDFAEYVDIVCTFSVFESGEMMKFIMYVLDPDKKGDADIKETEAFIVKIWNDEINSNIGKAVDYLKSFDEGDGRITFKDLNFMQKSYPSVFFPAYRLTTRIMQTSLGEEWWEVKKRELIEIRDEKKRIEQMKKEAAVKDVEKEEARQMEELVKKKMGVMYYLKFWERDKARAKIKKIEQLNKQLEALEKKEAAEALKKKK